MDVLPHYFKDQGELLDIIDGLRSQGLNSYISLPQLVVCGDQSAGKSSVLEGISGVAFPTKGNLCTRFATEVVLRRDAESRVHITIFPDGDRTDEEKEELRSFKAPTSSLEDLPGLLEMAKDRMGLNRDGRAFSKDILRIELSGPDQPHLTLVDLPGLIHAESKQQSAQDVDLVASLVRGYIANPRSIVLAVVSAKNDYAVQIVTRFTREVDPRGLRTLGLITKPDTLHFGSDSEAAYLSLARNEDVQFRLGWHVLRNREFDTMHLSRGERDEAEEKFFSSGVWQTLPLHSLGVESLRPRLSTVLKEQIISELPALIRDIKSGIVDARDRLDHLGDPRRTTHEQRLYLIRISEGFSSLLSSANNGTYGRDFFGDARTEIGFKKRLRAVVQDLLLEFAQTMQINGHLQQILDDDEVNSGNHLNVAASTSHTSILRSAYIEGVSELMRRTRGRELPGTFNPLIVGDLFFNQSLPWSKIVQKYMDHIVAAARTTVELVLAHSADASTAESLLREIINPAFDGCVKKLRRKIQEVLQPHQRGHPVTYNHYFTDTIQRARGEHTKKQQSKILRSFFGNKSRSAPYGASSQDGDVEKLLEALNPEPEGNMDQFACSEATYCMEAYYKVAMKTLVDNIAVLGIESCLLEGLKDAFTAQTVMGLKDDMVQKIAAEDQDSVTERTRTQEKVRILEDGLRTLNRYRRSKHQDSEMYGRNDLDDCETQEMNDPDLPTLVSEDVHDAVHDALQNDKPSVRTAETRETTLDVPYGGSGFQSSRKIPAKPQKKKIQTRVAMFDDNALGEQG
ncbi:hypothetical protein LTR91_022708 [Friedmanniomyces endolithicus]|uniref:GED domain-containing protein n=2 Tax=Friedmanniomyces endolithicus TaxID=329885 RepID=A0AAN6JZ33_9PEZI|nr:hypothetical protein LTR57_025043 [Friedmanniomyces endolithicus]KAK0952451.1 hypothetical protein LTS01_024820 [Friedmanniomyces endolithicus]KAK0955716.1 hypothetical protein LTR91_022708 [Friedmanniomyces endolithicus]KAK1021861.1 hypothetical protein LTS16_026186 [Friedmanniomyces endolithicus]